MALLYTKKQVNIKWDSFYIDWFSSVCLIYTFLVYPDASSQLLLVMYSVKKTLLYIIILKFHCRLCPHITYQNYFLSNFKLRKNLSNNGKVGFDLFIIYKSKQN